MRLFSVDGKTYEVEEWALKNFLNNAKGRKISEVYEYDLGDSVAEVEAWAVPDFTKAYPKATRMTRQEAPSQYDPAKDPIAKVINAEKEESQRKANAVFTETLNKDPLKRGLQALKTPEQIKKTEQMATQPQLSSSSETYMKLRKQIDPYAPPATSPANPITMADISGETFTTGKLIDQEKMRKERGENKTYSKKLTAQRAAEEYEVINDQMIYLSENRDAWDADIEKYYGELAKRSGEIEVAYPALRKDKSVRHENQVTLARDLGDMKEPPQHSLVQKSREMSREYQEIEAEMIELSARKGTWTGQDNYRYTELAQRSAEIDRQYPAFSQGLTEYQAMQQQIGRDIVQQTPVWSYFDALGVGTINLVASPYTVLNPGSKIKDFTTHGMAGSAQAGSTLGNIARSIISSAPMTLANAYNPTLGYVLTASMITGDNIKDYYDAETMNFNTVLTSIASGLGQAALETMITQSQMSTWRNAFNTGGKKLLDMSVKEAVKALFSVSAKQFVKSMASTSIQEGIEEVTQNVWDKATKSIMNAEEMPEPEAWAKELVMDFLGGALGGLIMGGIGTGVNMRLNHKVAQAVEYNAERYPGSVGALKQAIIDIQNNKLESAVDNLQKAKQQQLIDNVDNKYITRAYGLATDAVNMMHAAHAVETDETIRKINKQIKGMQSEYNDILIQEQAGVVSDEDIETRKLVLEDGILARQSELKKVIGEIQADDNLNEFYDHLYEMKRLEKEIKNIQEKYPDDPIKQGEAIAKAQAEITERKQRSGEIMQEIASLEEEAPVTEGDVKYPMTQQIETAPVAKTATTETAPEPQAIDTTPESESATRLNAEQKRIAELEAAVEDTGKKVLDENGKISKDASDDDVGQYLRAKAALQGALNEIQRKKDDKANQMGLPGPGRSNQKADVNPVTDQGAGTGTGQQDQSSAGTENKKGTERPQSDQPRKQYLIIRTKGSGKSHHIVDSIDDKYVYYTDDYGKQRKIKRSAKVTVTNDKRFWEKSRGQASDRAGASSKAYSTRYDDKLIITEEELSTMPHLRLLDGRTFFKGQVPQFEEIYVRGRGLPRPLIKTVDKNSRGVDFDRIHEDASAVGTWETNAAVENADSGFIIDAADREWDNYWSNKKAEMSEAEYEQMIADEELYLQRMAELDDQLQEATPDQEAEIIDEMEQITDDLEDALDDSFNFGANVAPENTDDDTRYKLAKQRSAFEGIPQDTAQQALIEMIGDSNIKSITTNAEKRSITIDLKNGNRVILNHNSGLFQLEGGRVAAGRTRKVIVDGKLNVVIDLVDGYNGGNRSLFHEGLHAAWLLFLTPEQHQYMNNYYSKKVLDGSARHDSNQHPLLTPLETKALSDKKRAPGLIKDIKARWEALSDNARTVIIEELAAEGFENWRGKRGDQVPTMVTRTWQRFADKVRNFLVALGVASSDMKTTDIFWRASTGKLGGVGVAAQGETTRMKFLDAELAASRNDDVANKVILARKMEDEGSTRWDIWKATGLERDAVGAWSYEIDALTPDQVRLDKFKMSNNWHGHPGYKPDEYKSGPFFYGKLFDVYPSKDLMKSQLAFWLKKIKVFVHQNQTERQRGGYWSREEGAIHVNITDAVTPESLIKNQRWIHEVILHEIQHAIQAYEYKPAGPGAWAMAKRQVVLDAIEKIRKAHDSNSGFSIEVQTDKFGTETVNPGNYSETFAKYQNYADELRMEYLKDYKEVQARNAEKGNNTRELPPSQREDLIRTEQLANARKIKIGNQEVSIFTSIIHEGLVLPDGNTMTVVVDPLSNETMKGMHRQLMMTGNLRNTESAIVNMYNFMWTQGLVSKMIEGDTYAAKKLINYTRRSQLQGGNEQWNEIQLTILPKLFTEMRKYIPTAKIKQLGRDQFSGESDEDIRDREFATSSRKVITDESELPDFVEKYALTGRSDMGIIELLTDAFAMEVRRVNSPDNNTETGEYLITKESIAAAEEMTREWLLETMQDEEQAWKKIGLDFATANTNEALYQGDGYDNFEGGGWVKRDFDVALATLERLSNLLRGELATAGQDIRYKVIGYHGSGAEFDRFDHTYMGTGEGVQAFGWGTYVTEREGVAKDYAQRIGGNKTSGIKVTLGNHVALTFKNETDVQAYIGGIRNGSKYEIEYAATIFKEAIARDYGYDISDFDDILNHVLSRHIRRFNLEKLYLTNNIPIGLYLDVVDIDIDKTVFHELVEYELDVAVTPIDIESYLSKYSEEDKSEEAVNEFNKKAEGLKKAIKFFADNDVKRIGEPNRNIYHVSAWDDYTEDTLDWYGDVSDEQLAKIQKHIDNSRKDHKPNIKEEIEYRNRWLEDDNPITGQDVYNEIVRQHDGSAKKASQFLLRAGIDGIKYPVNALSGGKGEKGWNYVVFDDKAITINKHERYKTLTPTQAEQAAAEAQMAEVRAQYEGTDQWLKAPNGKPTNLNERQWLQVRTPNFINWFGDWLNDPANASKVVDKNGEPMVVYHGTGSSEFTEFSKKQSGGTGFYFAKSTDVSGVFSRLTSDSNNGGGRTIPAFLSIKNPAPDTIVRAEYKNAKTGNPVKVAHEAISELGYDGIIQEGFYEIIAFTPTQIKSATANVGTFDSGNPDIRYKMLDQEIFQALKDMPPLPVKPWMKYMDELKETGKLNYDAYVKSISDNRKKYDEEIKKWAEKAPDVIPFTSTFGYGVVSRDTSGEDAKRPWRVTRFTRNYEPSGHSLFATKADAVKDAVQDYKEYDPDTRFRDITSRLERAQRMASFATQDPKAMAEEITAELAGDDKRYDTAQIQQKIERQIKAAFREGRQKVQKVMAASVIAGADRFLETNLPEGFDKRDPVFHHDQAIAYANAIGTTAAEAATFGADRYTFYLYGLGVYSEFDAIAEEYVDVTAEIDRLRAQGIEDMVLRDKQAVLEGLAIQKRLQWSNITGEAGRILRHARELKSSADLNITEMLQRMDQDANQDFEQLQMLQTQLTELEAEIAMMEEEFSQLKDLVEEVMFPDETRRDKAPLPTLSAASQAAAQKRMDLQNRIDEAKRHAGNLRNEITALIERIQGDEQRREEIRIALLPKGPKKPGHKPPRIDELPPIRLTAYDVLKSLFYQGILSSPMTHYRNVMGNITNIAGELFVDLFQNPGATGKALGTLFKGNTWHDAITGFANNISWSKFLKDGDILKKFNMDASSKTAQRATKYLTVITRLLAAEDAVFFNIVHAMQLSHLAWTESGGDQAKYESLLAYPSEDMVKQIHYESKRATFNHAPEGLLGIVNTAIEGFIRSMEKTPYMKGAALSFKYTVLPFTRIVANVANFGIDWSPLGFFRLTQHISKSTDAKYSLEAQRGIWVDENGKPRISPYQRRDIARQAIRASVGTIAMMLAATLLKGLISGGGPRDWERRRQLQQTGWRPYSILINGRWVPYNDYWFSMPLAVIGNLWDHQEYNQGYKPDSFWSDMTYAVMGISKTFLDKSFLRGLNDTFAAIEGQDERWITKKIGDAPGTFLIPNGARFINDIFYKTSHRPETLAQYAMLNARPLTTPWLRSAIPANVDVFGKEIKKDKERWKVAGSPIADNQPFLIYDRNNAPQDIRDVLNALTDANLRIGGLRQPELKLGNDDYITLKGFDREQLLKIRGTHVSIGTLQYRKEILRLAERGEIDKLEGVLQKIATRATIQSKKDFIDDYVKTNKLRHKYEHYSKSKENK